LNPRIFALVALARHGGMAVSEALLLTEIGLAYPALTRAERLAALSALEADGLITGGNDALLGRQWLLTATGRIRAQELDR
jgi:hypothetical protein